jgi:hypothetical protein
MIELTEITPRCEGVARPSQPVPEFFRLPKSGGDPYFGLGRSYYYEGEKQGFWQLVRIRQRGKVRGVTLVPYDVIAAYIRKQGGCRGHAGQGQMEAGYVRRQPRFDKTAAVPKCDNNEATIGGGR